MSHQNSDNSLPVSTSKPPHFPAEQVALFCDVLTLLNERDVAYAVSGAFALQKHTGIWRDTKDLDLFVPAEDASLALNHLKGAGFKCEITDPVWLAKAHRDDYFVDLITGMSNAALTVDRSWIERSTPAELFGTPTRVLAAEELFASKLFVQFRERFDGADMVHIIYACRGRLDWNRILSLAGEHRDLVFAILMLFHYVYPGAANTVPSGVWELLREELKQSLASPAPPRFRGTLLDDNMFAIDVKEWGLPDLLEQYRSRRRARITDLDRAA
jgi:hypothetical protein